MICKLFDYFDWRKNQYKNIWINAIGKSDAVIFCLQTNILLESSKLDLLALNPMLFYLGFRSRRLPAPRLPAPKAQKYIIFVNKLFSNVPRVIKKYMLSLTRAIIYHSTGCLRLSEPPGSRLPAPAPKPWFYYRFRIYIYLIFFEKFITIQFVLLLQCRLQRSMFKIEST